MIDRGIKTDKRSKSLGSESVHGLPLEWPEQPRKNARDSQRRREALLATQNVHGLPTIWDELDLSE
jgi:hypothetical protein